ncbi:hypothetical protein PMAYCL1PPCAC_18920, partial [Pristionchus mayeri]
MNGSLSGVPSRMPFPSRWLREVKRNLSPEMGKAIARFGNKDNISRLPDLCLLYIFQFLKRRDLFSVFLANKRLGGLASLISLEDEKWEGGVLSIVQTEKGFGFDVDVVSEEYPLNVHRQMTSFHYSIEWNEEGEAFRERRSCNGMALRGSESRHNLPVPVNFFMNLKEIFLHIKVKSIVIDG